MKSPLVGLFTGNKLSATAASTAVLAACLGHVAPAVSQPVLEEVVVTATKRSASVQDIPMSISQVGGEDLEDRGISNIENLSFQAPNLQFGRFGNNTNVTIRGIGTTVDSGVAEPAVATYVDGVFLSRATMGTMNHVDLDRVEVLRGPQGTLYGRNATGGAISYVSRAPSQDFEAGIRTKIENRGGLAVSAYASGPLSDAVSYRASLGKVEQDGYVDVVNTGQDLGGTDLKHGRVALEIRPSDDLTIDLSAQYQENDAAVGYQALLTPTLAVGLLDPNNNQTTDVNKVFGDGEFSGEVETTIVSAQVNWDVSDALSIRSITGYVDHYVSNTFDADATDVLFINLVDSTRPSESWSQEFNFYGETERLDWLVGAYYFKEDYSLSIPIQGPLSVLAGFDPTTIAALMALTGLGPLDTLATEAGNLTEETETFALFADITYSLTDSLRLLAGLRYNDETKDFESFGDPESLSSSDWLPKIGFQYDMSNNSTIYGQFQQGIKSGGHQVATVASLTAVGADRLFEQEELDSLEIGIKSEWMDGRLTANAALFSYDYQNLQASTTAPPSTTVVVNSDAEVFGGELELVFAATEALTLNAGLSLLDSEYKSFDFIDLSTGGTSLDLDGESLIRSPDYTFNLGAEYVIALNNDLIGEVKIRADLYHTDDFKLAFVDYDETRQDSYTTGNLSVIFSSPSEQVRVRAFVDNIGDEEFLLKGEYLATALAFSGAHSEPRSYGVELNYDF